jgi:lipopolysaccharide transport system permease protein
MELHIENKNVLGQPNELQEDSEADAAHTASQSAARFVLEPSQGWVPLQLRSLWEYRELFYFLVWRDVKVRYKQTVIGIAWAILQPVITMLVFSLVFGHLGQIPSDGIPYLGRLN